MREQGRHADAETLRTQTLASIVAGFRAGDAPDPTLEARLAVTMAEESERVINAALLAELLAPMLGARGGDSAVAASVMPLHPMPLPAVQGPVLAVAAVRPAASIADFLDEMIAQETAPARPRGPTQRRAS